LGKHTLPEFFEQDRMKDCEPDLSFSMIDLDSRGADFLSTVDVPIAPQMP
jgi:hypothetical protein